MLKKSNGPFRVLHAAAAMKALRTMSKAAQKKFQTAYNYLRDRSCHMQYAEFKRLRLPIGSGVTEAACKTVFTQRLKLSGMTWSKPGAQTILNLRVILLSGLWEDVHAATLANCPQPTVNTPSTQAPWTCRKPR